MLSKLENLKECMKPGGHPDRFVNQYEFYGYTGHPFLSLVSPPMPGEPDKTDPWGIIRSWRLDQPGAFPDHSPDKIVCKDIDEWQEYVHAPNLDFSEAEWEPFIKQAEECPDDTLITAFVAPGLFEQIHYLCEMTNALVAYYESPDEVHELIKYLTEFEIKMADGICSHIHPKMLLHHDDWGSRTSTFLSPEMFDDFFLDAYKEIYGFWHANGCEIVMHHSDSYAATLVPSMIEMGINIWQGVMTSNDIPAMIEKYGDKITFMGGLDGADIEHPDWNDEFVKGLVTDICKKCGPHSFIPCLTQGLPMSIYPGLYDSITKAVSECSEEMPEFFE